MTVYTRQKYLDKILPFVDKPLIKVLTGQRRVGKSYLLLQIIEYIKNHHSDYNIIHIDKESTEFDFIKYYTDLDFYVKSQSKGTKNYVFIDEIQEIKDFQLSIRSLLLQSGYDIYCTGSNAYTLSGDLATTLSGRFIEIRVHSLSYLEYLDFFGLKKTQETLNRFLKYGGMPFLIHLPDNEKIIYDYLKSIYTTIFFKDIVTRYQIKNANFLTDLTRFIAENCGSIFSASKISQYLKSQQIKTSTEMIINYLSYLESAFFIHRVKRTDIQGKKHFEIGEKLYFDDLGLRHAVIGYRTSDIGKIIENAVYLHLIIQEWEVTVGFSNTKEIDFVADKNGERIYIQVAYMLQNQDTIDREFNNLLEISDNYRKMVVTMDNLYSGASYKGIEHKNLIDFLTETL